MKQFKQITSLLLCLVMLLGTLASCDLSDAPVPPSDATLEESSEEKQEKKDEDKDENKDKDKDENEGEDKEEDTPQKRPNILDLEELTVEGFEKQGLFLTMSVDKNERTISLKDKISLPEGCHWTLLRNGAEIDGEILELENGDNFFSIYTWTDNGQSLTYDLKIFRPYTVKVSYYHGDKLLREETLDAGTTLTPTDLEVIDGYDFYGWKVEGGKPFTSATLWEPLKLYAITAAKQYKVTYDCDGGTGNATEATVIFGENFTLMHPTREGHTFEGWFYEGKPLTDGDGKSLSVWSIAKDVTLTASWTAKENSVSVRAEAEMGSVTGAGSYAYGETVTLVATPNEGYRFLGWYEGTILKSSEETYSFTMGTSSVALVAKWEPIDGILYRVKHYLQRLDGSYELVETESFAGYFGQSIQPSTKHYDGFRAPVEQNAKIPADGSLVIEYRYERNKYLVTFLDENGATLNTQTVTYGQEYRFDALSKEGHTFAWMNGESEFTELYGTWTITEDVTLTARWTKCQYSVTVLPDGAESHTVTGAGSYAYGDTVTLVAAPNAGYRFLGWYEGTTLKSSETTYSFPMGTSALTLTAKWEVLPELAPFTFIVGSDGIFITGLKDKTLTEITIPDCVVAISYAAFRDCTSLVKVTISDGVKRMGAEVFMNCYSLKTVIFGEGLESIGGLAFAASDLRSADLPDSLKSIGEYAFHDCRFLSRVTFGNGLESISGFAFMNCIQLTEVTLPASLKTVSGGVFSGCNALTHIYFDGTQAQWNKVQKGSDWCPSTAKVYLITQGLSYTLLEDGTYEVSVGSATNATEIVIPPTYQGKAVTRIASMGFRDHLNVKSIVLPRSIRSIGSYAFYYCPAMESILLEEGITSIENSAFLYCSALKEITLPSSATELGHSLLYGCSALTSATLPEGITELPQMIFSGCTSLASLKIPSGVKSIGSSALEDCESLSAIELPQGLLTIGDSAFSGCIKLTEITIPSGVTSMGASIFRKCLALKNITVPFVGTSLKTENDLKQYPLGYLFGTQKYTGTTATEQYYHGTSLDEWTHTTYYVPNTLRSITVTGGNILSGAFENFTKVTSITIPDGITKIADHAFQNCDGLKSITLPASVREIGESAFSGSGLKTLPLHSGITKVGTAAFSYCNGLTEVEIPASITVIPNSMFSYCDYLTAVMLPDTVTEIGHSAFADCQALATVKLPASVTSIGDDAFWRCKALTSFTIPAKVSYIGQHAFKDCENITAVVFENPNGWYAMLTETATEVNFHFFSDHLSDTRIATKYLTYTYMSQYWHRGETA